MITDFVVVLGTSRRWNNLSFLMEYVTNFEHDFEQDYTTILYLRRTSCVFVRLRSMLWSVTVITIWVMLMKILSHNLSRSTAKISIFSEYTVTSDSCPAGVYCRWSSTEHSCWLATFVVVHARGTIEWPPNSWNTSFRNHKNQKTKQHDVHHRHQQ